MTLGVVKEYWSATYEAAGVLKFTPWLEQQLDLIDCVAEKGGTIKGVYHRIGGDMFEVFPTGEVPISFG